MRQILGKTNQLKYFSNVVSWCCRSYFLRLAIMGYFYRGYCLSLHQPVVCFLGFVVSWECLICAQQSQRYSLFGAMSWWCSIPAVFYPQSVVVRPAKNIFGDSAASLVVMLRLCPQVSTSTLCTLQLSTSTPPPSTPTLLSSTPTLPPSFAHYCRRFPHFRRELPHFRLQLSEFNCQLLTSAVNYTLPIDVF